MRGNGVLTPVRVAARELVVVSNLFCNFGPLPAIRMHYSNSASAWCSLYCLSARLLEVKYLAVEAQILLYYIFDQLATFLKTLYAQGVQRLDTVDNSSGAAIGHGG